VRVDDFDFELPEAAIASAPAEPRDAARLLVLDRRTGALAHRVFRELDELLRPGDLLVLNDTRVLPWRLRGQRRTGGKFEVLIVGREGEHYRGFCKPARKLRPDQPVDLESGALTLFPGRELGDGLCEFQLRAAEGDVEAALERVGRAPLPPYIARDGNEDVAADRARYQTVFADRAGAIAAPTAGLHFTPALLERLAARGIENARVTLHVGIGTFAPLRVDVVEQHAMHAETYELPEATATAIVRTRARGGRVVAVGTTSVRTLETCAQPGRLVRAGAGATDIFLYPGRELQVVDALITNFHLPRSTLLMLVAAFAGRERILATYREALAQGYRFYSFGDAMLIE
jgi:S-adenosylmethionine:tRNA ribosyltransferase-isomerase